MEGVKTAYGEVEGFFGNNTAVGVYYNNFVGGGNSAVEGGDFFADDLWGAYTSVNFGSKWNVLANYET